MRIAMRTDVGRVRKLNEDALLAKGSLLAVADGMGGHQAGEVASAMAVESMEVICEKTPGVKVLEGAFVQANAQIYEKAQTSSACAGMGTTLTALFIGKSRVYIGHVGDSRAYLLREGTLKQVTQDHSIVAELMLRGGLTPEEARVHPYRNVITRALGTSADVEVDMQEIDRKKGDIWLVCSDGLTGMIDDAQMEKILLTMDIERAATELLEQALAAGGRDNITLILAAEDGRAQK